MLSAHRLILNEQFTMYVPHAHNMTDASTHIGSLSIPKTKVEKKISKIIKKILFEISFVTSDIFP